VADKRSETGEGWLKDKIRQIIGAPNNWFGDI